MASIAEMFNVISNSLLTETSAASDGDRLRYLSGLVESLETGFDGVSMVLFLVLY